MEGGGESRGGLDSDGTEPPSSLHFPARWFLCLKAVRPSRPWLACQSNVHVLQGSLLCNVRHAWQPKGQTPSAERVSV